MSSANKNSVSVPFERTVNTPLDNSSLFATISEANTYVSGSPTTAYVGQLISVTDKPYVVSQVGTDAVIKELPTIDASVSDTAVVYWDGTNHKLKASSIKEGTGEITISKQLNISGNIEASTVNGAILNLGNGVIITNTSSNEPALRVGNKTILQDLEVEGTCYFDKITIFGDDIKLGKTTLSETQLQKIINFIDTIK